MPTVAELAIKVSADTKEAEAGLSKVEKQAKDTGDSMDKSGEKGKEGFGKVGESAKEAGGGVGEFVKKVAEYAGAGLIVEGASEGFHFLADQVGEFITAGMQANQIDAQIAAGLKSTHDASGMTTDSLNKLADSMTAQTGITNDGVKAAESMLLTFTNIGKDTFPQATQAVADLATKMANGAVPSADQMRLASIQLGKALGDPLKGYSALQRVGVTFSDQQKEQIKNFMKAGDVAGAQNVILGEMNKEFGGSAAAAGQANGGIAILSATLDETKEKIGQALIPVLSQLMSALEPVMVGFSEFASGALGGLTSFLTGTVIPTMQQWMPVLGAILSGAQTLGNVFLSALKPALDQIGQAFDKAHGPGLNVKSVLDQVHSVIQGLVPVAARLGQAFGQLAQWFVANVLPAAQQLATFFVAKVLPVLGQVAGFIISTVIPAVGQIAQFIISTVVPAIGQLWTWFSQKVLPVLEQVVQIIITNVVPTIENIVKAVITDLVPALEHLWNVIAPILIPVLQTLGWIFQNVIGPAISVVIGIIGGLINGIADVIGWIEDHWKPAMDAIGGAFSNFGTLASGIWDGIQSAFKGGVDNIIGLINGFIGFLDSIQIHIPAIGVGPVSTPAFDWNGLGIPQIPYLASGGDVFPGGQAVVGEAGPELLSVFGSGARVQPLSGAAGGVPQMIQVNSTIMLDGLKVATVVTKHQPEAVRLTTGTRNF